MAPSHQRQKNAERLWRGRERAGCAQGQLAGGMSGALARGRLASWTRGVAMRHLDRLGGGRAESGPQAGLGRLLALGVARPPRAWTEDTLTQPALLGVGPRLRGTGSAARYGVQLSCVSSE